MGRFLGILTGTLSLVFLLWRGFDVGLGPTAITILDYYENFVKVLLGWSEPYIRGILNQLSSYIDIPFVLHEHWRHVFILFILYVSACTRSTWEAYPGTKLVAVLVALIGTAIALLASITSGISEVSGGISSLLIALPPIIGVMIFEFILTAINKNYFKNEGVKMALLGVISLLIAPILKYQLFGDAIKSLGLAMLGVFTVLLALYWVAYGALEARQQGAEWKSYFLACAPSKLGFIMLSSFAGAGLFILANAGLSAFGL